MIEHYVENHSTIQKQCYEAYCETRLAASECVRACVWLMSEGCAWTGQR